MSLARAHAWAAAQGGDAALVAAYTRGAACSMVALRKALHKLDNTPGRDAVRLRVAAYMQLGGQLAAAELAAGVPVHAALAVGVSTVPAGCRKPTPVYATHIVHRH